MRDDAVNHFALHEQGYPGADRNAAAEGEAETAGRDVGDGDSESGAASAIVLEFEGADDVDRETSMISRFNRHVLVIGAFPVNGIGGWP